MRRLFTLATALLLLSACQTRIDQTQETQPWSRSTDLLARSELPEQWVLNAKAGLIVGKKSEQANLSWQRTPEILSPRNNQIRLFGPFGAGAVELAYGPRNVVLTDSKGKQYYGDSAEALLTEIVGWPLPLDALQYWLFALPAPNSSYEFKRDSNRVTALRQMGWEIDYSDWRDYDGQTLPRKIFASKRTASATTQKISVRLVVKSWQWPQ